ncbi:MAG TPA: magnesium chelatase ATPase subunit I [Pyrinomonadaceae bacterium]|nr:magnesium chelatase ATPase subunit I [Pyrinomonadaceae bacterium]
MKRKESKERGGGRAHSGNAASPPATPAYPFTAVVGQEEMKLALLLSVVEPNVGGVLVTGHRGTAKSTAVRALASLLPALTRVRGCAFNCDPEDQTTLCPDCRARLAGDGRLPRERVAVPVVDLPLNATEDRLCGTLDIGRALREGRRSFEPGLLARAHRGLLYIDEVNLLEDHLVDLFLDAAASGSNRVEREGVSFEHAARFVLVGSSNPEEGELRPQLLDRFGLCVEVRTADSVDERVRVVESREAYDRDPVRFAAAHEGEETRLRRRLARARRAAREVRAAPELVRGAAELCLRLKVDGHRGELTLVRAARALAALEGRREATAADARRVAAMSLRHRLRTDPLEQSETGERIERATEEVFGAEDDAGRRGARGEGREPLGESRDGRTRRAGDADESARDGNEAGGRGGDTHSRGGRVSSDGDGGAAESRADGRPAPLAEANLNLDLTATESRGRRRAANFTAPSKVRSRSRSSEAASGRYARADREPGTSPRVAVDATLRAAAQRRVEDAVAASEMEAATSDQPVVGIAEDREGRGVVISDLRFKRFTRREGTLYVCAVDASGSMAVNRIRQAKGALARLLRRSYVSRDRVALVGFRGEGAELLLRPSLSGALAKRRLDELTVGGATPLAAGLKRSLEVARSAARRGARRIVLLVFTDGRANVPLDARAVTDTTSRGKRIAAEIERLGSALRSLGVASAVVDTRRNFGSGGEGESLARALGGRYLRLPISGEGELPV